MDVAQTTWVMPLQPEALSGQILPNFQVQHHLRRGRAYAHKPDKSTFYMLNKNRILSLEPFIS